MPELPEVETICRSLRPQVLEQPIIAVTISNVKLRQQIPKELSKVLPGQRLHSIERRSKYILLGADSGSLIIHLGMTGSLQVKPSSHPVDKHEHFTINFANNSSLCYNDPRRFGLILWTTKSLLEHKLLKNLGCEPLTKDFTTEFLYKHSSKRKCPIKQLLMDNSVVVGIGNIYATEILFAAGINPWRQAASITLEECRRLVKESRRILRLAIKYGGTTISDYIDGWGNQGAFQKQLKVYGKAGLPCVNCRTKLITAKLGQRSTVFCPRCQKI
jgi:formamidopyrimidine-DNA glycosylase